MGNSANGVFRQRNDLVFAHEARESPLDAEDLPSAVDCGEDGGADDGVESGRVTAAGRNCNSHYEKKLAGPGRACLDELNDFTGPGVSVELGLFEDRHAVGHDLEPPPA